MAPASTGSAASVAGLRSGVRLGSWTWPDTLVVAAQALVFVPMAIRRYADGDEGAYLAAATLVVDGQQPYTDFLYTQTPLLPYVYGGWFELFGESWYAVRFLSVLLAAGLGLLLFRHAERRFGTGLGLAAAALYVSASLVFVWFTTVKTQALATLLLFAAYVVVDRTASPRAATWLTAGLLLGLAIDTRLIFAVAVPAFGWAALRAGAERGRSLLALAGGLAVGLLPSLVFLALDPGRFVFGNLGYHAARSSDGLVGDFAQKVQVAENLLGIGTPDGGQPQYLLLLVAAAAGAVGLRALGRPVSLALVVAALLAAGSFLPTPSYPQYFATTVPFLVLVAVEFVAGLRDRLDAPARRVLALALVPAVAVFGLLALRELARYTRIQRDDAIPSLERIASLVDANTRPGEEVLASWPGYLFGTHAAYVPGMENDFANHEAAALSPEEVRRYRLATADDVERMLREGRTRVVVFKLWHELTPIPDWEGAARAGGYRVLERIGAVTVYVRS